MTNYRVPASGQVLIAVLVCWLISQQSFAEPWIDVGDSSIRHDIQVLADAGVIRSPVSSWPLSSGDIGRFADADIKGLTDYELSSLVRVRARIAGERVSDQLEFRGRIAAASNPRQIRTFESSPREEGEVEVEASWMGDRFAFRLRGQYANNPQDDKEWRGDGSYAAMSLGNWMLAGSMTDRWWGPGWQSSLILSSNARPIPALTLERNFADPFKSKWLSWIGPWDASLIWGFLESGREVPDARFFGMRVNFKPFKSLEIGLSRTAQWCGEGRPCGASTFWNLLKGNDNRGDNISAEDEPGNQLGGWDIRWSAHIRSWPFALYWQEIGEDEQNLRPAAKIGQWGGETWGNFSLLGDYRLFLEWSDTVCGYKGSRQPNCAYNHTIYKTGYRYRGRSIGHSADNDASVFTIGGVLTDYLNGSWTATVAFGDLNRIGKEDNRNTQATVETRYREIEVTHRRSVWIGSLNAGVGYEMRENRVTKEESNDFRVFAEWSVRY